MGGGVEVSTECLDGRQRPDTTRASVCATTTGKSPTKKGPLAAWAALRKNEKPQVSQKRRRPAPQDGNGMRIQKARRNAGECLRYERLTLRVDLTYRRPEGTRR